MCPAKSQISLGICRAAIRIITFLWEGVGAYWRLLYIKLPKSSVTGQYSRHIVTRNKTCRRTGQLGWNHAFPFWSILESDVQSCQTWIKCIKGFAKTDTVKIQNKNWKSYTLQPFYNATCCNTVLVITLPGHGSQMVIFLKFLYKIISL